MTKISDTPIYNVVMKYAGSDAGRFHTPGHSGGKSLPPFFSFAPYDITELSFSDNLENPTSVILRSEQKTAIVYGAKRSLYFTSGATTALFCAVYSLKNKGKALLTDNCHKSVFNALTAFGFEYETVPSNSQEILRKLKEYSPALFIFTSPDYFGKTLENAKDICDFCKKNDISTVCDEAHGSHFVFSSLLPSHCDFADMTVDSMHKTMPVQTGGAVLNVYEEKLLPLAENARKTLNTTSPAYITLASMDYAVSYMYKNGEKLYSKLKKTIDSLKLRLKKKGVETEKTDDFSRLVLRVKYSKTLAKALEASGVYPEGYTRDEIIFIVTPFNADKLGSIYDFFKKNENFIKTNKVYFKQSSMLDEITGETELVPLKEAEGRVASENVGFYPPATPFVKKGEVFSKEKINALLKADKTFGLYKDKVAVYKLPLKQ